MHVLPKLLLRPLLFAAIVVLLAAAVAGSASGQQKNLRPASMTKVHHYSDGSVLPPKVCHVGGPHDSHG